MTVLKQVEKCAWLARVPVTRDWPPDFTDTLKGEAPAFIVEMSTAPGCVPCADLWAKLTDLGRRYGWKVRAIGAQEAMLRSGRLGLPWVGHPRHAGDPRPDRMAALPLPLRPGPVVDGDHGGGEYWSRCLDIGLGDKRRRGPASAYYDVCEVIANAERAAGDRGSSFKER